MFSSRMRLGVYEVVAPIGAGGMGEVYRARDTRLERDVALKVLPAEFARDPSRRARFEREARSVATLNHPNIIGLFDIGTQDGVAYMVTRFPHTSVADAEKPMGHIRRNTAIAPIRPLNGT